MKFAEAFSKYGNPESSPAETILSSSWAHRGPKFKIESGGSAVVILVTEPAIIPIHDVAYNCNKTYPFVDQVRATAFELDSELNLVPRHVGGKPVDDVFSQVLGAPTVGAVVSLIVIPTTDKSGNPVPMKPGDLKPTLHLFSGASARHLIGFEKQLVLRGSDTYAGSIVDVFRGTDPKKPRIGDTWSLRETFGSVKEMFQSIKKRGGLVLGQAAKLDPDVVHALLKEALQMSKEAGLTEAWPLHTREQQLVLVRKHLSVATALKNSRLRYDPESALTNKLLRELAATVDASYDDLDDEDELGGKPSSSEDEFGDDFDEPAVGSVAASEDDLSAPADDEEAGEDTSDDFDDGLDDGLDDEPAAPAKPKPAKKRERL